MSITTKQQTGSEYDLYNPYGTVYFWTVPVVVIMQIGWLRIRFLPMLSRSVNSFNKILVNGIIYFHIVNRVMPIVALLPISFNLKKTWSK